MAELSRRRFMRIAGGTGAALLFAPAVAGCEAVPAEATEGWIDPGALETDVRLKSLAHAILAPNPHNRQPWIADISVADEVTLYCDADRLLPVTDPFSRQILIGHGCFLGILEIAAHEFGYRTEIELMPEGAFGDAALDGRPVARIRFHEERVEPDPLFAHITRRHTNKEPYDTGQSVPGDVLDILESTIVSNDTSVLATNDEPWLSRLRDLTWRAHHREVHTPAALQESVDLMRVGSAEILTHRDGIDLGGTIFEFGRVFGLVTRETLADTDSYAFGEGLAVYHALAESAMGFMWIVTSDNARETQIRTGMNYVRLQLTATSLGLDMHPWSQSLQEYPEMGDLYDEVHRELGVAAPDRIQMLCRLGYGPEIGPSPRRDLAGFVTGDVA